MSGTTIGEVNINLRMSLAQFRQDTQQGTQEATAATKEMADGIGQNTDRAKGSLALLGEEVGVRLPRHIRSFVTELPGVAPALDAAFSAIAVVALIEVVVKVIEKIEAFKKAQEDAAAAGDKVHLAMEKTGQEGRQTLDDLQAKFLGLTQGPITEMEYRLQHVNEILLGMKLAADLKTSFDDLQKSVHGVWYEIGSGAASDAMAKFKDNFFAILNGQTGAANPRTAAFEALIGEIQKANDELAQFQREGGQAAENGAVSMQKYISALRELQSSLDTSLVVSAKKRQVDETAIEEARADEALAASNKIIEARNKELEQFDTLKKSSEEILIKNQTQYDQEIIKVNELIQKWVAYKTEWESAHQGISTIANAQIQALTKEVELLKYESDNAIDAALKVAAGHDAQKFQTLLNTPSSPGLYGGTKEAEDLYNIQTKTNIAVQEAQKVYTATRTSAEQYNEEVTKLNSLLKQGQIDQETYNRALYEAKQKYDQTTQDLTAFGTSVGDSIKQSVLFGASWTQTLQSIAIDLVQLILKMTLLKSLTAASMAGGGGGLGGFFSAIVGGLSGAGGSPHMDGGGRAEAGHVYEWNELGREYFMPDTSGVVVPSNATSGGSGSGHKPTVNNFHFHGVQDFDSFKKSQSQLSAEMARVLSAAAKRHG